MDSLYWYNLFTSNVLAMVLPLCILIIISRLVAIRIISFKNKKITYIIKTIGYSIVAFYICSYYFLSGEGIMHISVLNGFTVLLCCLEIVDNMCCIFEGSTSKEFNIDTDRKLYNEIMLEVRELRLNLININFDIKPGRTSKEIANKIKNIEKIIFNNKGKYLFIENFLDNNLLNQNGVSLIDILDNLRKTEILRKVTEVGENENKYNKIVFYKKDCEEYTKIINDFSNRVSYLENKIRDFKKIKRTVESIE
ncbi:MAG: hypothetical protein E6845_18575 [Clostridium sp.]|uniref:hypothetical protein n=1 Tax=Clostridium sp. TaxID=1506 RepID=UPI0029038AD4|nr:hypothetical protein [Clostridium sp.]MDU1604964.1 hypothetical protein [Clostridium sp.]